MYAYDYEPNVVGERELHQCIGRFDLDPYAVRLIPTGDRAAWNPFVEMVAIYGVMLSYGVTLPIQPFISRFLVEAQLSLAQLALNSYRILMSLWYIWHKLGLPAPTPCEIRHFHTLRHSGQTGTYFLLFSQTDH